MQESKNGKLINISSQDESSKVVQLNVAHSSKEPGKKLSPGEDAFLTLLAKTFVRHVLDLGNKQLQENNDLQNSHKSEG